MYYFQLSESKVEGLKRKDKNLAGVWTYARQINTFNKSRFKSKYIINIKCKWNKCAS